MYVLVDADSWVFARSGLWFLRDRSLQLVGSVSSEEYEAKLLVELPPPSFIRWTGAANFASACELMVIGDTRKEKKKK